MEIFQFSTIFNVHGNEDFSFKLKEIKHSLHLLSCKLFNRIKYKVLVNDWNWTFCMPEKNLQTVCQIFYAIKLENRWSFLGLLLVFFVIYFLNRQNLLIFSV